jgi:hypothetical protein
MGVGSPTTYFYGPGHRYNPAAQYASSRPPLDSNYFRGYAMQWDSVYLGGVFTIVFILWNLVWSELLNFLLLTYVLEWQLLVNVIMMFIELGLIVLGLVATCLYAWYADVDVYKLKEIANLSDENKPGTVSQSTAVAARRSRANINMDLTMCLVLLSFNWLEVAFVSSYAWGTAGNAWATKTPADVTTTNPLATYNYALTDSHWGTTFNARLVEQTFYRSLIHFFIMIKGIVFMVAFFLSRFPAMDLAERKAIYDAMYIAAGSVVGEASPHFLNHVANRAAPLMSASAVPMTTFASV